MQRTPGCRTCVPAEVSDGLLETHAWNEWMISRAPLSLLASDDTYHREREANAHP
jgi:hypothetical protein